jgi:hypothetical protein
MLTLDGDEFGKEPVVLRVIYGRLIEDVVTVNVLVDFAA